jgi:hypothetical protein
MFLDRVFLFAFEMIPTVVNGTYEDLIHLSSISSHFSLNFLIEYSRTKLK